MPFLNFSNWRGPGIYLRPGETLSPEREKQLTKTLDFDFVNERSLLFGSPDEVVEKIEKLRDVAKVEHVLLNSSWHGIPHELTMRSMRLFAEHVMPKFKRDARSYRDAQAPEPAADQPSRRRDV